MPAKLRAAKDRRPVFTTEAVALFLEIERTPGGHMPYSEASGRLAEMLGLVNEWCSSCHVNDRSSRSHYPPGHLTDIAFWKVREVRNALLAVAAGEPLDADLGGKSATKAEPLDADAKDVDTIYTPGASSAA